MRKFQPFILSNRRAGRLASAAVVAIIAAGVSAPAFADDVAPTVAVGGTESIVVTAEKDKSKLQVDTQPTSEIATSYSLDQTDIKGVITAQAVDLIRTIPGVYGGYVNGGIATGPGLRGWSGTGDGNAVATYIDNYQHNTLSAGNSNGYNNLNVLIPETIGSLDLIKGPFSIQYGGPFSFAGSLVIQTADYLPTGFSQSVGSFGRTRSLATYGYEDGGLQFYSAFEGFQESGYRQNSDNQRLNWFSKLTLPVAGGTLRTSLQVFQNNYGQPMYPGLNDVLRGPRTQAVNLLDKGNTFELTSNSNYALVLDDFEINVNATVDKQRVYRSASRRSNSNPAAADPALQNITYDNRWVYGGGIDVFRPFTLWEGGSGGIRVGGTIDQNDVHQNRFPGFNNQPSAQPTFLDAAVQQVVYWSTFSERSSSAYLEAQFKPVDWIKISGGFRYDDFSYGVNATSPSGVALPVYNASNTVIVTPAKNGALVQQIYTNNAGKFSGRGGIAILPFEGLSLYANVGEGVNPNHAITDLRTNPNLQTIGMISEEIGTSYDNPDLGIHLAADGYYTINSGEIATVGGVSQNVGKSRRRGGDVDGSVYLYRKDGYQLQLTASASAVKARTVSTPTTPYITGVPPWQWAYGLDFNAPVDLLGFDGENVRWTAFHEFIGPMENNAAGTVEVQSYDRLTTKIAYGAPSWHGLNIYLGAIYYPDSVTSECCSYTVYDGSPATAIVPRWQLEGGVSIQL
jgi:outer membrane receptor protein involved in Fe transport